MMETTVNISGIDVKLKATAALAREYRAMFGRDIFADFAKIQVTDGGTLALVGEGSEVVENVTYAMAKSADPDIPPIEEWLSQFDLFALYQNVDKIFSLWTDNVKTTSTPKKANGRRTAK